MLHKRNPDEVNKRCEFLESLGFTCLYEDIEVEAPNGFLYDFSAVRMEVDAVIGHVISKSFEKGWFDGQRDLKNTFKKLMSI